MQNFEFLPSSSFTIHLNLNSGMRTLDRLENFSASSTETLTPTSETCPLLKDPESAEQVSKPSPVPFRQLSTLCALRLADPICFTQIFPYVNEMMETFQICEPSKTVFYSGIVVSIFHVCTLRTLVKNPGIGKCFRSSTTYFHLPMG